MPDFTLRPMQRSDWPAVAELIHQSTNAWYQRAAKPAIFGGPADDCELFCRVYEALDPGCCVLAVDDSGEARGRVAGSCFYHPRDTHVSLGIMNAHPDYFGRGVARRLLSYITDFADRAGKPLRLVSSAMNLDSYSLYSRAGFVPRIVFHDMLMPPAADGSPRPVLDAPGLGRVRDATADDVKAMADLEQELAHIRREKDYAYFVKNDDAVWHVSVYSSDSIASGGGIDGFLVSVADPCSHMLGPGVARTQQQAAALIAAELNHHRDRTPGTPVWLVPAHCDGLVQTMYAWGARNCELHLAQCRGQWSQPAGVAMPTFMPETG
jgi:GNAT superfamily N-acetyltransferase